MTTKIAIVAAGSRGVGRKSIDSLARRGVDTPAALLWADNRRVNAQRIAFGAARRSRPFRRQTCPDCVLRGD